MMLGRFLLPLAAALVGGWLGTFGALAQTRPQRARSRSVYHPDNAENWDDYYYNEVNTDVGSYGEGLVRGLNLSPLNLVPMAGPMQHRLYKETKAGVILRQALWAMDNGTPATSGIPGPLQRRDGPTNLVNVSSGGMGINSGNKDDGNWWNGDRQGRDSTRWSGTNWWEERRPAHHWGGDNGRHERQWGHGRREGHDGRGGVRPGTPGEGRGDASSSGAARAVNSDRGASQATSSSSLPSRPPDGASTDFLYMPGWGRGARLQPVEQRARGFFRHGEFIPRVRDDLEERWQRGGGGDVRSMRRGERSRQLQEGSFRPAAFWHAWSQGNSYSIDPAAAASARRALSMGHVVPTSSSSPSGSLQTPAEGAGSSQTPAEGAGEQGRSQPRWSLQLWGDWEEWEHNVADVPVDWSAPGLPTLEDCRRCWVALWTSGSTSSSTTMVTTSSGCSTPASSSPSATSSLESTDDVGVGSTSTSSPSSSSTSTSSGVSTSTTTLGVQAGQAEEETEGC